MVKYERRPEAVEAVQWFPGVEVEGVLVIPNGCAYLLCGASPVAKLGGADWILTHADGTRTRMGAEEFAAKYRVAE